MPDKNRSELPDEVEIILKRFRSTTPVEEQNGEKTSGNISRDREMKRQQCVKDLIVWSGKNLQHIEGVQNELVLLLDYGLYEQSESDKIQISVERGINDLMRSYLPIFIGALHCGKETRDDLKNKARNLLFSRLTGENSNGESGCCQYRCPDVKRSYCQ